MIYIYNFSIRIYWLVIAIAAAFNSKAKLWLQGRKKWETTYADLFKHMGQHSVWFHCASLGEFEQAKPLIELIKNHKPSTNIIISFSSPSGYENRKHEPLASAVIYLPIDTANNARNLINLINPSQVFFVKYEFWYHYIYTLFQQKVPIYLLSGNFRKEQLFFKWYGGFYRRILTFFSHIYLQNSSSASLLESISITRYSVQGDTRFDRCWIQTTSPKHYPIIESFIQRQFCLIAGSTWPDEEKLLLDLHKLYPQIKIIIAPHEISRSSEIASTFSSAILYSNCEKATGLTSTSNILIIDKIGMLAQLYQYASVALVGGGFSGQLHNILEAAAWGKPVIYGPNTYKFPEGDALVHKGGGFKVSSCEDLVEIIKRLYNNKDQLLHAGNNAKEFIISGVGATERVYKDVFTN